MIRELIGYLGLGAIAYGVWMIYRPAGVITAGVLLVVLAVLAFDGEKKKTGT
jgi:hypothetical protein